MTTTYSVTFNDIPLNADSYQPFVLQGADLTGGAFKMTVKSPKGVTVATFELGTGFEVVDATAGKFALHLTKALLAGIPHGTYNHDLIYTESGGAIDRIWAGTITFITGVTP